MKRNPLAITLVIAVLVASFIIPIVNYQSADAAAGWLATYNYRQRFTISNGAAGVLTDYQVEFHIDRDGTGSAAFVIDLAGHALNWPDDIRFTNADGVTLLDYWQEENDATDGTWWVELDSLAAAGNTDFYIYYGTSSGTYPYLADEKAHGDATFIIFDDFERGIDSDEVGGIWTEVAGTIEISTAHDAGDEAGYYGTRSMKLVGVGGGGSQARFVWVAVDDRATQHFVYKEDATNTNYYHGDGVELVKMFLQANENIDYEDDLGIQNTGTSMTADSWEYFGWTENDWTGHNYDIYYDKALIQNNADMLTGVINTDLCLIFNPAAAGNDTWIDNWFIWNFDDTAALTATWGAEGTAPCNCTSDNVTVEDVAIFTGYLETGDWLVTCRYTDDCPCEPTNRWWYLALTASDNVSAIYAEHSLPAIGYKPGSIYINAADAAALEWEGDYAVAILANYNSAVYSYLNTMNTDWMGDDLNWFDSWCLSSASLFETYYGTAFTTYVSGKGQVMNDQGNVVFSTGIPLCSQVRPDLFETTLSNLGYSDETWTEDFETHTTWQAMLGPTMVGIFTSGGNVIGINGRDFAALVFFAMFLFFASFAFKAGHGVAATAIGFIFVLLMAGLRVIDVSLMLVILAVVTVIGVWQVVFRNA